ncbi:MAG: hypothetical protein JW919_02255 [Candidatus Omnitrophica bacterium]|nr:hypothetical protein [Candidatus Omnitrophota bacterium]
MKKIIVLLVLLQISSLVYAESVKDVIEKKNDEELIKSMNATSGLEVETRGDEIAKNIALNECMQVAKKENLTTLLKSLEY